MLTETLKLCLITHPEYQSFDNYEQFILKAINGGVTSIQLRNKTIHPSMLKTLAISLISLLRPLKIPLIINDNVELAKEIDASGVHLGQSDLSPIEARKILGKNKIIGWSIETYEHLQKANQLTCINYIAASAIFPSKNKQDCKTIWGLDGLKEITRTSTHPVIAIGGINISNIREVIKNGAYGAAVISAIHENSNPEQAAFKLTQEISACTSKLNNL